MSQDKKIVAETKLTEE
jgi:hypothetical protein